MRPGVNYILTDVRFSEALVIASCRGAVPLALLEADFGIVGGARFAAHLDVQFPMLIRGLFPGRQAQHVRNYPSYYDF